MHKLLHSLPSLSGKMIYFDTRGWCSARIVSHRMPHTGCRQCHLPAAHQQLDRLHEAGWICLFFPGIHAYCCLTMAQTWDKLKKCQSPTSSPPCFCIGSDFLPAFLLAFTCFMPLFYLSPKVPVHSNCKAKWLLGNKSDEIKSKRIQVGYVAQTSWVPVSPCCALGRNWGICLQLEEWSERQPAEKIQARGNTEPIIHPLRRERFCKHGWFKAKMFNDTMHNRPVLNYNGYNVE